MFSLYQERRKGRLCDILSPRREGKEQFMIMVYKIDIQPKHMMMTMPCWYNVTLCALQHSTPDIRINYINLITYYWQNVLHTQIVDCEYDECYTWNNGLCLYNMILSRITGRRMAGGCLNSLCPLWAPVIRRYPSLQTGPEDQGVLGLPGSQWVQDYPVEIKQNVDVKGTSSLHFVVGIPSICQGQARLLHVQSCLYLSYFTGRSSLSLCQ